MRYMPVITLVLHNIRSTHNVGAIFRTAEGFGVKEIICSGYTPYPATNNDARLPHIAEKLTNQIRKTALGADALVPFRQFDTIESWRSETTLPLIALEQSDQSIPIGQFTPPTEFALLLGEEVNGIEAQLLKHCQSIIEIPMYGQKESFNVAVATGIALYALITSV